MCLFVDYQGSEWYASGEKFDCSEGMFQLVVLYDCFNVEIFGARDILFAEIAVYACEESVWEAGYCHTGVVVAVAGHMIWSRDLSGGVGFVQEFDKSYEGASAFAAGHCGEYIGELEQVESVGDITTGVPKYDPRVQGVIV